MERYPCSLMGKLNKGISRPPGQYINSMPSQIPAEFLK